MKDLEGDGCLGGDVIHRICPFSPLSLPFKPFKPLGSGACETSVTN